jgi:DNA-binding CsgD family transcriptional regulator/tetratricopeptide (TPR) repeat protein
VSRRFVGRVRELGELERVLDATRAGRGGTVLVEGEPGIGKSRLASELARRAQAAGFEVLVGHAIDLVGTELPYQPFAEALRPLGGLNRAPDSQMRVFEETLALLADRGPPMLLVLEDLHWADTTTLDLVVFLAHNLHDRPVALLATCRADELSSAERVRRLAAGVRRSGSALVLELGPLERDELRALLAARADAALTETIVARSEGNPFFAEELLAAAGDESGELPRRVRDVLLHRLDRLDGRTRGVLRVAAAAGREVTYPLLRAATALPEADMRESLRQAVEHGVIVADQAAGTFRFRHALLAEAIYATILPGEREDVHGRLAEELARGSDASQGELAPHWAAAGRSAEALAASVEAARQAHAVFGLAEALAHVERALRLWDAVPEAAALAGLDLAELCSWGAELAGHVGAAPRALELAERAIELADPSRAALLHASLGEHLLETGADEAALAAFERAVELTPADPPSRERAYALSSLAGVMMVAWRHAESAPVAEQALALARETGAREAEVRALTVLGGDLAYLGRREEGLARFRQALQLAEEIGDHLGLDRAYVNFTDALTMLGQPGEAALVALAGLEVTRRFGHQSALLACNRIEALLAIGEWDEADRASAAALRANTASYPYVLLTLRADSELGRGDFEAARAHLEAASTTLRRDHVVGQFDGYVAELALWEHRWADAAAAIDDGLALARPRGAAPVRVLLCAKGLRALAELAALARARRDAAGEHLLHAETLLAAARDAAAEASPVTPNAAGWLALAEAEHERAAGASRPDSWSDAATTWMRLERPPLAAYCRWREAEALVAAGAPRAVATAPLREAHAVASRIGAAPLLRELELVAERARLDLSSHPESAEVEHGLQEALGLTPREAEVLTLVARGLTNREIADALVISVKTAGVHVSHILRKLDAPNRLEAAAIAHRVAPPAPAHRRE